MTEISQAGSGVRCLRFDQSFSSAKRSCPIRRSAGRNLAGATHNSSSTKDLDSRERFLGVVAARADNDRWFNRALEIVTVTAEILQGLKSAWTRAINSS
jgi:hypothetical protein